MYGIGWRSRFKDGKVRKFFEDCVKQEVCGILLAFIVTDIGHHQFTLCFKKFVVPDIRRNEKIGIGRYCIGYQEATSSPAEGHATNRLSGQGRMAYQGDPELLRRAFENVIRNAIRHAPAGTSVEVSLGSRGRDARVVVRDFGPGVPAEALPSLFEPFFRVEGDRGRDSGGVGLGLAIARRATAIHGGTIEATNAMPGLSVEIVLPPS